MSARRRRRQGLGLSALAVVVTLAGCTPAGPAVQDPEVVAEAWSTATSGTAPDPGSCSPTSGDGRGPDAGCTPGAITAALGPTDVSAVCLGMAGAEARVPRDAAEAVLDAYGLLGPDRDRVEAGFLIPPALGGANDFRNIWPIPRADRVADLKRATDIVVMDAVCDQRAGIQAAQFALATDWTSAVDALRLDTDLSTPIMGGLFGRGVAS